MTKFQFSAFFLFLKLIVILSLVAPPAPPVLGRRRQEDYVQDHLPLPRAYETSLKYTKPCINPPSAKNGQKMPKLEKDAAASVFLPPVLH